MLTGLAIVARRRGPPRVVDVGRRRRLPTPAPLVVHQADAGGDGDADGDADERYPVVPLSAGEGAAAVGRAVRVCGGSSSEVLLQTKYFGGPRVSYYLLYPERPPCHVLWGCSLGDFSQAARHFRYRSLNCTVGSM